MKDLEEWNPKPFFLGEMKTRIEHFQDDQGRWWTKYVYDTPITYGYPQGCMGGGGPMTGRVDG